MLQFQLQQRTQLAKLRVMAELHSEQLKKQDVTLMIKLTLLTSRQTLRLKLAEHVTNSGLQVVTTY